MRTLFVIVTSAIWCGVTSAKPACMTRSCIVEACVGGDGAACMTMGDLTMGTPDALIWLANGCRLHDARSCERLGTTSPYGRQLDVTGALAADEKACTASQTAACLRLVMANQWNGHWQRYRERACDLGDAESCGILGVAATEDARMSKPSGWRDMTVVGTGKEWARAEGLLVRSCTLGSDDGCLVAAREGVRIAAVEKALEQMCDRPVSAACWSLAHLHDLDDPPRALALYERGCRDAGLDTKALTGDRWRAESCAELGTRVSSSDTPRSRRILDAVCASDAQRFPAARACRALAGVTTDPRTSRTYRVRACKLDPQMGPLGISRECKRLLPSKR